MGTIRAGSLDLASLPSTDISLPVIPLSSLPITVGLGFQL